MPDLTGYPAMDAVFYFGEFRVASQFNRTRKSHKAIDKKRK